MFEALVPAILRAAAGPRRPRAPRPAQPRGITALLLLLALLLTPACVQRELHITSEPSGAIVHVNDQEVGRTPVTVPFTFYGTYDVRLEAEGYQPLWTARRARAPWWEFPGPDLVAETIPGTRSDIEWHFELEEATDPGEIDEDRLLDHARQLRTRTRQEQD